MAQVPAFPVETLVVTRHNAAAARKAPARVLVIKHGEMLTMLAYATWD